MDHQTARPLPGLDAVIDAALADRLFTGAACGVWLRGKAVYRRFVGYGSHENDPDMAESSSVPREVDEDSLFDLASMTKPLCTAVLVHRAAERGELRLDDSLGRFLPQAVPASRELTIRSVLAHASGLPAVPELQRWFPDPNNLDPAEARRRLVSIGPERPAWQEVVYSCTGFLYLGLILERVTGLSLGELFRRDLAEPLGLAGACFAPGTELRPRAVATEICAWRGRRVRGEVHDESSYCLGGEAGNAGLFAGLDDVGRIARIFLEEGAPGGTRILSPESVGLMTSSATEGLNRRRSLGFAMHDAETQDGPAWSDQAFGHTGFTGTSVFIEPRAGLAVVALTNSVFYGRAGREVRQPAFRRAFGEAALAAFA